MAGERAEGGTLVINGDLFHHREHISVDVIHVVSNVMRQIASRCEVIISPGNHDQWTRNGEVSPLSMFAGYNNVRVVKNSGETVKSQGYELHILPFTDDNDKVREFSRSVKGGKKSILVLHQEINGAVMRGSTSNSDLTIHDILAEQFLYVIVGHIHKPQIIGDNVWYIGSPLQHDWGEAGEKKRFLVLEDDNLVSVQTNMPEFVQIRYEDYVNLKEKKDYYRVVVDGDSKVEGNVQVVRRVEESNSVDISVNDWNVLSNLKSYMEKAGTMRLFERAAERI
jgi:DNA repair exonuclease SbcCD nuclease subunit